MSEPDLIQLKLILQHIEQQDANGRPIKYSATKEFRKLITQNNKDQSMHSSRWRYEIMRINQEEKNEIKQTLTFQNKQFLTSCLLEGNIIFIETFQDHQAMDYFADIAQMHTFGYDSNNFGTMFLNDNNPTTIEQQNSQNFVRMLLECCVILSQVYPIRQNKQRSISKFRELIETLKQGGCFIPSDRKIQTQDINVLQNALVDQNYVGASSNGASQQDYHQQNAQTTLGQTQLGQQGSKSQLNQSQANKSTPQPPLSESMATKIKALTADDYIHQYQDNLKLLEQIRLQCITTADFSQQIDSFIKKLSEYKKIFDACNISNEEIQNKSAMISIVDQEVLDQLQGYKQTKNADNLINYFLTQYEQTYTGFLGEPLPNEQQQQQQKQGQKSDREQQKKSEQQKQKELQEQQRKYEQEQRELEELQNERNQQMLQRKEEEKQKREEEEAKWRMQQAQDEQRLQQEKQQQLLKKQKEDEVLRQLELERQQQLLKKQKEEEMEKQREYERQQQIQKKQKEEEMERQRQREQQNQQEYQNVQHQSMIKNSQPQNSHFQKHSNFEEDIDEGIYTGHPKNDFSNKNTLDHNIYQTRQHKVPSVIEEENEDYTQSNRNLSQQKYDLNQSGKKFHHSMNQSNFNKSSSEMKNSRFQAAINHMADLEKSKLRESRISARSHYEMEKSHSLSRLDPNKSKPIITKGISREEHKAAVNKEKEEQHKLEKIIFTKDAEISSQKDAMKILTKEMIELKNVKDHLEKDIVRYQQKIQLYESGNLQENAKYIEQINILEQQNNDQNAIIEKLEQNNQNLIHQKLQMEETINRQEAEKQELEQKLERIENDLEAEKQKQKLLENRITERLSKNQSQLEKEVTQLSFEKTHLEGQIKNISGDYEKLLKQFNEINQENLHIKNDYAAYRSQVESDQQHLNKKSSKSQKQLEEYENLAQELRVQIQKLSDENKKQFEKNKLIQKELETKDLEIETLNDKIMSLENDRMGNQEIRLDNQIKTTNDNHKYIEMRQKWQEEKNLHQENLNKFKKELKALKDQNEEMTAQLVESQNQVQDIKNQMTLMRNTHNEEMAKFISDNTKQLGNELGEKEDLINKIQRELLKKNQQIEEGKIHFDQQLQQEHAKVVQCNQRIAQLEKELEENYNLLQDVSNKNHEQQLIQYKHQIDKFQEDAQKQIKLNQEQNELIFQIHKDLNQEKKTNEELKQKYNVLNEEINRASQHTAQLENDKQNQLIKYKHLEEEHNNLIKEFQDLKLKHQANQPDAELLDKIQELQEVNSKLHSRIDQLMLEASQINQQQEQQAVVQGIAKGEHRIFGAQKPNEIGDQQEHDHIISNSMLSDARRINDYLDETNKEPKQLTNLQQFENSAQRQPYHSQQQQIPVRLSEMGRRNQFYSPETRQFSQQKPRNISQDPQYHLNYLGQNQATLPHKVSPKYFEAQDNYDTIPVKFASDMRQVDPESAALIFPFQNPIDYYENKAPKMVKGKLIRNDYNLFNYLPQNHQILYRFKRGCLKENFPLFQNEDIQIGVISRLLLEDRADILEIVLYFTNRTNEIITDFQVYYNPGKSKIILTNIIIVNHRIIKTLANTLEIEPQELDTELLPGVQKSQRLLIGINEVPFEIILLDFSYRLRYQTRRYNLAIPNTLNKFFEPKMIDISTFKYLWSSCKDQIYRSEDIQLDEKVAKSSFDFLNYFKNFMEINESKQQDYMMGLNENKVGGCFQLKSTNTQFLVKVSVGPNSQAIFQVALLDQNIDQLQNCVLENIIQTFSLIFRSEQ